MSLQPAHHGPALSGVWYRLAAGVLLLISLCFCSGIFLIADRLYTRAMAVKAQPSTYGQCVVVDTERTHALKPNCMNRERWGKDSYDFVTNSLGFRDERMRVVPLKDPRPRIILLGDSFTESKTSWASSYAGKLAARFPQYEILNGGVSSYSPSNYWNIIRNLLQNGFEFDEVFVFIDMSDTQDEAAYYRDVGTSGAVAKPQKEDWSHSMTRYHGWRTKIEQRFLLTNFIFTMAEAALVDHGVYYLSRDLPGNIFDQERSAWTYRRVSDTELYLDGYAPLGVAGGIAKEKRKMELLWRALTAHGIPLNVVVYPWPAQVVHDTADSPQVRIWRDWCAGKCRDFISVFPSFIAEKNRCSFIEPGCWYMRDFVFGDFHYNDAGNTIVANAVAASLQRAPAQKSYTSPPSTNSPSDPISNPAANAGDNGQGEPAAGLITQKAIRRSTFSSINAEKIVACVQNYNRVAQAVHPDRLRRTHNPKNYSNSSRAEALDSPQCIVLDMYSMEAPVYCQQENSAYNGHFESTCSHPLLLFNREGDCLAAKLRPGNVHSADNWEELLLPEIERQQKLGKEVVFRADAAFAKPEIYEALEERGVKYAIRIPANENLERDIAELLTRPLGRPSHKPVVWYKGFLYQAASWKTARRVVAKVEFHFGELFPRVGFIVTNLETDSRAVVRFYNKRGTAEQWIKEGKQAVKMTRLSCHRFRSNEVRLWLSVMAYNLGNLWRRLVLPKRIENWSLTSLQQRLVKTGGRLVKHPVLLADAGRAI